LKLGFEGVVVDRFVAFGELIDDLRLGGRDYIGPEKQPTFSRYTLDTSGRQSQR
jgi:hypothetical protein